MADKCNKEALSIEYQKLDDVFNNLEGGFYELDRNWNFVYISKRAAKNVNSSQEALIGKPFWETFAYLKGTAIETAFRTAMNQSVKQHLEFYVDARKVLFDVNVYPSESGIITYFVDITERKKAEEAIRESEERFSKVFQDNPTAMVISHTNGVIVDVNNAFTRLLGYEREEAIGKQGNALGLYAVPSERQELIRKLREKNRLSNHEITFKHKSGKPVNVIFALETFTVNGQPHLLGAAIDVTQRKKAEEALKNSEREHHDLFENMTDGFAYCQMIYDKDQKPIDFVYLEINESFEKITGLSRQQVVGKRVTEAFPGTEKTNPELFEIYGRVATTCQKEKFEIFFKPIKLWLSISVYCPRIGYFVAVFENITGRKKAEDDLKEYSENLERLVHERTKELKNAERLAAIGATAGMVGHDIRNPLQAITSDLYLLKEELTSIPECKTKAEVYDSLEGIENNVDYINKIVADLQDYARAIRPAVQEVDLKNLIEGILFKNGLPTNIKVTSNVEDNAKLIMSDKDVLTRILSNLANNAIQAMPNGGALTIHAYKEKQNIAIAVEDTGVGIPEEIKDKLFTPMFTTKSKGQGFGLAVVKRMAEALGGTVTYESQVGKGTKFIVSLPLQRGKR